MDCSAPGGQTVMPHSSATVVSSSCFGKGIEISSDQKIKVSLVLCLAISNHLVITLTNCSRKTWKVHFCS